MAQGMPYQPIPDTRQSIIVMAADAGAATQRDALDQLARLYIPALRCHLMMGRRWRGRIDEHQAEDMVAQFVLSRILEKQLLQGYDGRRRFRNLLLTALDHFVIDELRKRRIEATDLDNAPEPVDASADPDDGAFMVELMRTVIEQTVERMRVECETKNKPEVLAVLTARLIDPLLHGKPPMPFEQLVTQLGIPSVGAASNLMVTAKRSFKRHMAAVCADMGDAADELTQRFRSVLGEG